MEKYLKEQVRDVPWVVVHPGTLTNGSLVTTYKSGVNAVSSVSMISRDTVAYFMIKNLVQSEFNFHFVWLS